MMNNSDIRGVYALGKLWTVLSDATASCHKSTQANEMPEENLKIINKEIFLRHYGVSGAGHAPLAPAGGIHPWRVGHAAQGDG